MEIKIPPTPKEKRPPGRAPNFSPEYYMLMAKKVVDDGMSYREASKTFSCSHGTVSHWVKLYRSGKLPNRIKKEKDVKKTMGEQGVLRVERYIKELKQEIADLYLENTMLKKALEWARRIKNEDSSVITSENLALFQRDAK